MRVYVSGPMMGKPDHNAPALFEAKKRLRKQGHFVINPYELSGMFGRVDEIAGSFAAYYENDKEFGGSLAACIMDADLAAVRSCDAIYMLKGWEDSRGAKAELAEAIRHGLKVMQEGVKA